ncbi:tetratricopeptide repeat protein [Micromonospora sp. WMMD710]|uniref:tetratricopeptide repeat protein n=1 Tax=Micromonospora sp. WMMD710 TaxID=3016085 RepID=UPI002415D095|nr:tetratricopeptide repeat protein [Micromonospora sp. WMMD710]MDG4760407.1 tetratricopeptide repeat protein [Micromonospora sp. WMMD710]
MPSRTSPATPWTPAFVADAVAATLKRAAEHDLHHAITEVARERGLSQATIDEWVARARAMPAAPIPPGLVTCHDCHHPMILVQLPKCPPVYLCMPACGRTPVPAQSLRDAVARAVLHRAPHLVPKDKIDAAAAYAPGGIHRVAVGASPSDLHFTWRSNPRQLVGPRMSPAQRLNYARARANHGDRARAIEVLHTGLLHTDPTDDSSALDVATANSAALLAELALADGDPNAALPWAGWAHRSLRRLRGATSPEATAALKVLAAAYRRTGNLPEAADCYRDLIRHHTSADGPRALPTLAAQATLALALYQDGHCAQARQLLARAAAEHRAAHPGHRDGPRLRQELNRMRATCVDQRHGHPAGIDDPPHDIAAALTKGSSTP